MDILIRTSPKPNIKKQTARQLVEFTRNNFESLLRQWETGMQLLWGERKDEDDVTFGAKEILAILGKDASDLFTVSAGLREYLETLKPGCTLPALIKYYKPVTVHPDGTVTVDVPAPTPEPEPTPEPPV